jgi:hypothetical protein
MEGPRQIRASVSAIGDNMVKTTFRTQINRHELKKLPYGCVTAFPTFSTARALECGEVERFGGGAIKRAG